MLKNLMIQIRWNDIHPDFGKYWSDKTYQQTWTEEGLTYQDARTWIPLGFTPKDYKQVKKWKSHSLTPKQTQSWLAIGLTKDDHELAGYLNYKYHQPSSDLPWWKNY